MKNRCFLLLAFACTLLGASRVFGDLPSTSQPFKSGVGYNTYRIPAMVVSNKGTVIVSADGRANAGDIPTAIDCVIRRSTDNGDTWGPRIIAANYGTNSGDTDIYPLLSTTTAYNRTSASDPALLVDRTGNGSDVPAGRIWVFYDNGSNTSYNGHGRTIKLELRYSDDDGLTWSSRYDVEAVNPDLRPKPTESYSFNGASYTYGYGEYIVGPGNGIQIENGPHAGRLIFPVYWYRTNNCSSFIYSDDHGKTWQRGGICGRGTGEIQIVELADGSLMSSMRPSGVGVAYRIFTKSTDGGATWTTIGSGNTTGGMSYFGSGTTYPVPDPACQGNIFRLSTTADSTRDFRIASDRNRLVHANAASTGSRAYMTVHTSYDEGLTWSKSALVYTPSAAYSALARLATGDIGLLYEKDGYGAIDFVRITIPEATGGTDAQPAYNLWAKGRFTLEQLMDPSVAGQSADPDGNGRTNYQEFQDAVAARPAASVVVTDVSAYEAGGDTTLAFAVTLSQACASDVTVNLSYGGSATAGTDYATPPATLTIPAGQTQGRVTLTALQDGVADGSETVTVAIAAGGGDFPAYTVGTPSSASGIIDDLILPGVTVLATDATASKATGDTATFTISRTDASAAATVGYTMAGTAVAGTEYVALPGTIAFAAGQASASITLTPVADDAYTRAPRTAILSIAPGSYTVGSPSAATVEIAGTLSAPAKANNSDALNLASSWRGDIPVSTEIPVWDDAVSGSITTSLGVNTTWAGIVDTCTRGTVTLNGAYTLSAGAVTVGEGADLVLANGTSSLSLSRLAGPGILTISKSGTQDMSSSLNSAGAIDFTGTLRLRGGGDGSWLVLGGASTTQATGTKFHLDTGASATNKRELVLGDAWNGRTLTLASLSGYGRIRSDWGSTSATRTLRVEQDIDTTFQGTVGYAANTTRITNLVKAGVGTLTMAGNVGAGYSVNVTAAAGTLVLSAANTYTGTATVAGGTLVVTGSLPATATTVTSGTLAGTGTIGGPLSVSGTLSPGVNGIGTLTCSGTVTFNAGGTAAMQVNKSGTTLTADKISGVTTLTYGGTLSVTATGDALSIGDTFTLFSATAYSGSFSTLALPTLPSGLDWDTSSLATNGSISVKARVSTDATWTNAAGGTWSTASNWQGGVVGSGSGILADFSTLNLVSDATVTLDAARTIGGLKFGDTVPGNGWTLSGPGALTLAGSSGTPAIAVGNGSATIATVVAGSSGLAKAGAGTLVLTGANTYSGSTTIGAGILEIGSAGTLYSSAYNNTDTVTVGPGATLRLPSFGYNLAGSLGQLADYSQRRVLNGGTFEVTGATHSSGNNFTVAAAGGTFRYTPSGQTLTLGGNANGDIQLDGTITFDCLGNISVGELMTGTGGLAKSGAGTLTLNSASNAFSGDLSISGGTLQTGTAICNGTVGYLGAVNGTRTIEVGAGGTLLMRGNNTFGGSGKTAAGIPSVTVSGGTLDSLRFNILGNLALNGATLTQSATDSGGYEGWQFIGTVTVGGSSASTIGSGNGKGNHLRGGATTVFDVADATGGSATDLLVSNALRDGSGDYTGAGALRKDGAGTMQLAAANTYSGATTVNGGTLLVTGSLASPATTVASGATLGGTGTLSGTVEANGILAPGTTGAGALTLGAATLGATGVLSVDIVANSATTPGTDHDQLVTPSLTTTAGARIDLVLNASGSGVDFSNAFWQSVRRFKVVQTTSAPSVAPALGAVSVDSTGKPASAHGTFSVALAADGIEVVWTPGTTPIDAWRLNNFGAVSASGNAANDADPDHDGRSNLLEYALAGANPLAIDAAGVIPAKVVASGADGFLAVQVSANPSATDVTIAVEFAASPTGPWTEVLAFAMDGAFRVYTDPVPLSAGTARFFRVKVTPK